MSAGRRSSTAKARKANAARAAPIGWMYSGDGSTDKPGTPIQTFVLLIDVPSLSKYGSARKSQYACAPMSR